jgi:hypothetical protein
VPYAPRVSAASTASGILSHLPGGREGSSSNSDTTFNEDKAQLEQRLALVAGGLSGTGVRAVPLGTEEVIELLYRSFNPGELENPIRLDN